MKSKAKGDLTDKSFVATIPGIEVEERKKKDRRIKQVSEVPFKLHKYPVIIVQLTSIFSDYINMSKNQLQKCKKSLRDKNRLVHQSCLRK